MKTQMLKFRSVILLIIMLFCSNAFSQVVLGTIEMNKELFNNFLKKEVKQQELSKIDFENYKSESGNWLSKKNYLDFEVIKLRDNKKASNIKFVDENIEEEEMDVLAWMSNFEHEEANLAILEEEHELEEWMLDDNSWVLDEGEIEKEQEIEDWMLNDTSWLIVN